MAVLGALRVAAAVSSTAHHARLSPKQWREMKNEKEEKEGTYSQNKHA
jgi:hypothetical protein